MRENDNFDGVNLDRKLDSVIAIENAGAGKFANAEEEVDFLRPRFEALESIKDQANAVVDIVSSYFIGVHHMSNGISPITLMERLSALSAALKKLEGK